MKLELKYDCGCILLLSNDTHPQIDEGDIVHDIHFCPEHNTVFQAFLDTVEHYDSRVPDEVYEAAFEVKQEEVMRDGVLACPECDKALTPHKLKHNSERTEARNAVYSHLESSHPELGVRERSELADQAIEQVIDEAEA